MSVVLQLWSRVVAGAPMEGQDEADVCKSDVALGRDQNNKATPDIVKTMV